MSFVEQESLLSAARFRMNSNGSKTFDKTCDECVTRSRYSQNRVRPGTFCGANEYFCRKIAEFRSPFVSEPSKPCDAQSIPTANPIYRSDTLGRVKRHVETRFFRFKARFRAVRTRRNRNMYDDSLPSKRCTPTVYRVLFGVVSCTWYRACTIGEQTCISFQYGRTGRVGQPYRMIDHVCTTR